MNQSLLLLLLLPSPVSCFLSPVSWSCWGLHLVLDWLAANARGFDCALCLSLWSTLDAGQNEMKKAKRGVKRTIKVERKTLRIFNFFYLAFVLRPFVMFASKLFVLLLVSLRCVYAKRYQLPTIATNSQLLKAKLMLN